MTRARERLKAVLSFFSKAKDSAARLMRRLELEEEIRANRTRAEIDRKLGRVKRPRISEGAPRFSNFNTDSSLYHSNMSGNADGAAAQAAQAPAGTPARETKVPETIVVQQSPGTRPHAEIGEVMKESPEAAKERKARERMERLMRPMNLSGKALGRRIDSDISRVISGAGVDHALNDLVWVGHRSVMPLLLAVEGENMLESTRKKIIEAMRDIWDIGLAKGIDDEAVKMYRDTAMPWLREIAGRRQSQDFTRAVESLSKQVEMTSPGTDGAAKKGVETV